MSANATALVVAVVGVLGTLLSPVFAQRSTARAAREAAELQRQIRLEERAAASARVSFEERRAAYVELNALARACRNLTKDCASRHTEAEAIPAEDIDAAHRAWHAYQTAYDHAQLVLPDHVLAHASRLNRLLSRGIRMVRELAAQGTPSSAEEIKEFCNGQVLDLVTLMRRTMRDDLGVSASSDSDHDAAHG